MRAAFVAILSAGALVLSEAPAARAQGSDQSLVTLPAPRSADGEEYLRAMRWNRVSAQAQYAKTFDPSLLPEPVSDLPRPKFGSIGTMTVILVLVGLLLIWLRFGGAGMVLGRTPAEADGTVPEHWDIPPNHQNASPQDLLAEIRAMPDRAAALVRLLRHALVAAGQRNDTRFARSDTEREAFARLPANWPHHSDLGALLRQTELAHYGGRAVEESDFDTTVTKWSQILGWQSRA